MVATQESHLYRVGNKTCEKCPITKLLEIREEKINKIIKTFKHANVQMHGILSLM